MDMESNKKPCEPMSQTPAEGSDAKCKQPQPLFQINGTSSISASSNSARAFANGVTITNSDNNQNKVKQNHDSYHVSSTTTVEQMAQDDKDYEDDSCVYTYKGGSNRSLADLPASFFEFDSLDCNGFTCSSHNVAGPSSSTSSSSNNNSACNRTPQSSCNCASGHSSGMQRGNGSCNNNNNNIYSPDMDFLEMDFDPGIPGESEDDEEKIAHDSNSSLHVSNPNNNTSANSSPSPLGASGCIVNDVLPIDMTDGPSSVQLLSQSNSILNNAATTSTELAAAAKEIISPRPSFVNEPQPHCSKNLFASPRASNNCVQLGVQESSSTSDNSLLESETNQSRSDNGIKLAIRSDVWPHPCPEEIFSSQANSTFPRPQVNLSMRLVKSNTLPKMGSPANNTAITSSNSPTVATPSTTRTVGDFTSRLRTSGLSYSVPLMDTTKQEPQEHYKAVLMTSPKMPNQGPIDFDIGEIMIWTLEEAMKKSLSQIGVSACGATAVLNVLTALGYTNIMDQVKSCIGTRLRDETADLPEYLFSRSVAGTTHEDLIRALNEVSDGFVYAKFFYLEASVSPEVFCKWLLGWICKGAIPIVTRNLQVPPYENPEVIPDAWHHQMVFGLSPKGLYLNNPIECTPASHLLPHLKSASTLLVTMDDVTTRMSQRTDLRKLARHEDPRWNDLNVLGQVANIFLEQSPISNDMPPTRRTLTSHIRIPAAYKGGITLSVLRSSPYYQCMVDAPEQILPC